jgi:hypothetical protein
MYYYNVLLFFNIKLINSIDNILEIVNFKVKPKLIYPIKILK